MIFGETRLPLHVLLGQTGAAQPPVGLGTAGAFNQVLEAHPSLAQWIAEQIRAKRVSVDQIGTDYLTTLELPASDTS